MIRLRDRVRKLERILTSPLMLPLMPLIICAPTIEAAGIDPALLRRPNILIINNFMPGVDADEVQRAS